MARHLLWLVSALIFVGLVILIDSNSAQWVFLVRVQWVVLFGLTILPLLAHSFGRELLIGAYELNNRRAGFHVGLLLMLVATSIVDTADTAQKYGQERLREPLGNLSFPSWGWILLASVMVAVNVVAAFAATSHKIRIQVICGLIAGFFVGAGAWAFLEFFVARQILSLLDQAVVRSTLVHACGDLVKSPVAWLASILPPWMSSGYFRLDKNAFLIEPGHIRAAVSFVATTGLYSWLRTKRLAPLCYFLLLTTVILWSLSGLSFFLDAFRIPFFVPILLWLSVAALHQKADHFYRVHQKVSEQQDVCVTPSDPGSILERAIESDDRIILVAAGGGGIQASAWTARVLTGLEEICAEKQPGRFSQSLKLLSGVSGGSVGIMYFVTACKLEGFLSRKRSWNGSSTNILQAVADVAKESSLSEAIQGLAYTDFIRAVTPFLLTDVYRDRAEGLEKAWIRNAKELSLSYSEILRKATLRGWQKDVARGELPAVIFNATIIETGERLAFSTTAPSACLLQEGLTTCAAFRDFSSAYEGADIAITTAVRLSSAFPFISPPARPLPAASLPDGKPIAGWQRKGDRGESGFMNMHLADGGYYDNSGVAALVQWLHNGLSDLASRNPTKLPKHILVIRINAFPASEKGYVKKHRGTFFQIWAPLLSLNTSRGAAQACSADRELQLLRERWSRDGLALQKSRQRLEVAIETVDFTFSPSGTRGKKPPPLSWHLRMEEQAEIENAWNEIRTNEQVQKVLAYLGVRPLRLKRTTRSALRDGHFTFTALVKRTTDARKS
jgi:Patatin-like phospholipase